MRISILTKFSISFTLSQIKKTRKSNRNLPTNKNMPPPKPVNLKKRTSDSISSSNHGLVLTRNVQRKTTTAAAVVTPSKEAETARGGIRLLTRGTKEGSAILMNLTGKDKQSCYAAGINKALDQCPDVKAKLKIHYVRNRVDPNDPCAVKQYPPKPSGYAPKEPVFVGLPLDPKNNTQEKRDTIARSLCVFNNSPEVQSNFYNNQPGNTNFNNLMVFDGDVTPEDLADAPTLSEFLTIGDLMEILGDYYKIDGTDPPTKPSDKQLVSNQNILDLWFAPRLHEKVKALYGGDGSYAPGFMLPDVDL
jgi:hypothetical protein